LRKHGLPKVIYQGLKITQQWLQLTPGSGQEGAFDSWEQHNIWRPQNKWRNPSQVFSKDL